MSDFDFKDIGPLFKEDEINNTNITENNKDSNVNTKNDEQKASDVLSILRQNDKIYEELKTQPEEKLSPEEYSKNLDKIRNEDVLQKNFISQEDLITPLDSHKTTNQKSTIKNIGNTLLNTGSKVVNKGIYAINLINQQVEKGYGRNVNRFFSKVFEIDTKNKFSPFPIAEKAPHLLSLEKKAVNVDATFVRKCHDKPMQGAGSFTFAELYAEAQSPEEFAFLDMFFAKTIATNLEIITSNKEFAGGMHIAIAGNIGCGKTTLTKMLANRYNWTPRFEPVDNNPYLEDYYADMNRWSFNLQIYFLAKRFKEVVEISKSDDAIIQDRTIFEDACIFAPNLHDMGLMSDRDFKNYSDLFDTMISLVKLPDLMIYIRSSIPNLVQQIQKRGRDFEQSMRMDYLKGLNDRYEEWIKDYKGHLVIVDGDTCKFQQNPEDFKRITDQMLKRICCLPRYRQMSMQPED